MKHIKNITLWVTLLAVGWMGNDMYHWMARAVPTETAYVAPVSSLSAEYEKEVDALWKSEKVQGTCRAIAASDVSLKWARKFLEEADKQTLLSQWDVPVNDVIK